MSKSNEAEVQPFIEICFWCGQPTNKLTLAMDVKEIAKDKKFIVNNYDQCDSCAEAMEKGVTLIEAQMDVPVIEGQHPMQKIAGGHDVYPTGKWAVVSEKIVPEIFQMHENILEEGCAFVDVEAWKKLNFEELTGEKQDEENEEG
jgi:hypothetical protein